MSFIRQRFYEDVDANTESRDEYVPASGDFLLTEVGGNSAPSADTSVKIIWDYGGTEELLFSTHGDAHQQVDITLTADGVKKLAIVLTNDQGVSDVLGGFWKGKSV